MKIADASAAASGALMPDRVADDLKTLEDSPKAPR